MFFILTAWLSLDLELLEVDVDLVAGPDVDEPVTLLVAAPGGAGVLLGVVGAGDDAVLLVRDVSAAFWKK